MNRAIVGLIASLGLALATTASDAGLRLQFPVGQPALASMDSTSIDVTPTPVILSVQIPLDPSPSTVIEVRLFVHLLYGESRSGKLSWALLNQKRNRWITQQAPATRHRLKWQWFSLPVKGELQDYLDADGLVTLRMKAPRKATVAVDYLALTLFDATVPDHWKPQPDQSWRLQLSSTQVDPATVEPVVDLDLFEVTRAQADSLHAQDKSLVCYFSAGSYENWRPDEERIPRSARARPMDGWPGERWLDVRRLKALRGVLSARLDLAVAKGCDGVDPDNVDVYANAHEAGRPVSAVQQLVFNRWLADAAHSRGLAVGLKNDNDQAADLVEAFDWELNEQCFFYAECAQLSPFVEAGKPVVNIEYREDWGADANFLQSVCPQSRSLKFQSMFKNLDLGADSLLCPP